MTMRYAHEDDVLHQLKLSRDKPADAAAISRVERLESGLCAAFDEKVGTSFGGTPEPVTRTARGPGSTVLTLEPRAVAIASVAIGGTWDGAAWTDETVLALGEWINYAVSPTHVYAIQRVDGLPWIGPIRVTAVWDDQPTEGVPADVREALTFLTVDEYRVRTSSPAGEIGPDGLMLPVRNPWRYELVRTALRRHRVRRLRVGV